MTTDPPVLGSITLPEGVVTEDMRWLMLSWDLRKRMVKTDMFYSILLTPDVIHVHHGEYKEDTFHNAHRHRNPDDVWASENEHSFSQAMLRTQSKVNQGFEWVCQPFVIDLGSIDSGFGDLTVQHIFEEAGIRSSGAALLDTHTGRRHTLFKAFLKARTNTLINQRKEGGEP